MNYTLYDPETGAITGAFSSSSEEGAEANLAGKSYVPGRYDPRFYQINLSTGQPELKPGATPFVLNPPTNTGQN